MLQREMISKIVSHFYRGKVYWLDISKNPPLRACAIMAFGLCFTFIGYEYARAASITLLAAEEIGFGTEALPLTVAVGSPLSGLVLYLYTKSIKKYGSKLTLRLSHFACIILFFLMLFCTSYLRGLTGKVIVVLFYASREIYISLLSSQQWAFISSALDKTTSSYLVTFSGVVSIASAVGGCTVEQLVSIGGLNGLLLTVFIMTIIGSVLSEAAFTMFEEWKATTTAVATAMLNASTAGTKTNDSNHEGTKASIESLAYNPEKKNLHQSVPSKDRKSSLRRRNKHAATATDEDNKKSPEVKTSLISTKDQVTKGSSKAKLGFWLDSWNLVQSNSILKILFIEAVAHQMCTNMLNIMFYNGLRSFVTDDTWKAKLVGRFFATVNVVSSTLQCFVLPIMLSQQTLPSVLYYSPIIVLIPLSYGLLQPDLIAVMVSFGTMKVLEYSIMHSVAEMIYMPLGHEVRYVGKELVKFFGHKLGKSFASLILSVLIAKLTPSLWWQIVWGAVFTILWGLVELRLSSVVLNIHAEQNKLENNRSQTECAKPKVKEAGDLMNESGMDVSNTSRPAPDSVRYDKVINTSTRNSSSSSLYVDDYPSSSSIKSPNIRAPISTANMLLSSKRIAAVNTINFPRQYSSQKVRLHTSTSMPLFAHFAGEQRKRSLKYMMATAAGAASPRYPLTPMTSSKEHFYQGGFGSSVSMNSLTSSTDGLSPVTSRSSIFDNNSIDDLRSIDSGYHTASTTTMTTASTAAGFDREEEEYAVNFEDFRNSPQSTRDFRTISTENMFADICEGDEKSLVVMQSPNSGVILTTSSELQKQRQRKQKSHKTIIKQEEECIKPDEMTINEDKLLYTEDLLTDNENIPREFEAGGILVDGEKETTHNPSIIAEILTPVSICGDDCT